MHGDGPDVSSHRHGLSVNGQAFLEKARHTMTWAEDCQFSATHVRVWAGQAAWPALAAGRRRRAAASGRSAAAASSGVNAVWSAAVLGQKVGKFLSHEVGVVETEE